MATRVESTRNLVSLQSLAFIRPITLLLTLKAARPSSKIHVFFDNELVDSIAAPVGQSAGTAIVTDANGEASINLYIPGGRFTTGDKTILLADTSDISQLDTIGSTYGYAKAVFSTNGVLEKYQTIVTTTNIITRVVEPPRPVVQNTDPIAQSFFTYGVTGGCFLTSIELYFQTKDSSVPVQVELRTMTNGYPDKLKQDNPNLIAIVNAANVNVSNDASVATKFTFPEPIYLRENSDYAFVVFSNSNNYNMFTSNLGEVAYETGKKIFKQPYVGSLFKSENNITWTANQFEDVKFKLNVAQFNTSVISELRYRGVTPSLAVPASWFSTVSAGAGKTVVKLTLKQQHGLEVGNNIKIVTNTTTQYNGLPAGALNGTFTVVSNAANDEFTVHFEVTGTATSFTTINADTNFDVYINAVVHSFDVLMSKLETVDTSMDASVLTTLMNYSGGGISSYSRGKTYPIRLGRKTYLEQNSIVASRTNEQRYMSDTASFDVTIKLSSDNPNVSPVIDLRTPVAIKTYGNTIRGNSVTSETTATAGNATSRYISKRIPLATVSNGVRLFASIYSEKETDVRWYIRTSLSGSNTNHTDITTWTELVCETPRNKSTTQGQYFEYEFKADSLPSFDTYDLKCELASSNPAKAPIVRQYRVIVIA
jgi:hypothetical protein